LLKFLHRRRLLLACFIGNTSSETAAREEALINNQMQIQIRSGANNNGD
jgi:hypothetical protein